MLALIRRRAAQGLSASKIAQSIGFGTTKNMVCGLGNRARPAIRFSSNSDTAKTVKKSKRVAAKRKKAVRDSKKSLPEPIVNPPSRGKRARFVILKDDDESSENRALHLLESPAVGRCKYPLWPDRIGTAMRPSQFEMMYCGRATEVGSSWCPACREKVFMKAPKRVEPGQGRKKDDLGRRMGWQYGT